MIKVIYVILAIVMVIGSAVSSIPYFTMDTIETIIVKKQKELSVHGIDLLAKDDDLSYYFVVHQPTLDLVLGQFEE